MPIKFKVHEQSLKKFEKQLKYWLFLGFLYMPTAVVIIVQWDAFVALRYNLWLLISMVIAGIGISWWFWTIHVIKRLIRYRIIEIQILTETVNDLKSLIDDIKQKKIR